MKVGALFLEKVYLSLLLLWVPADRYFENGNETKDTTASESIFVLVPLLELRYLPMG